MSSRLDAIIAKVCGVIALLTGGLVLLELPLLTGCSMANYKHPYSTTFLAIWLDGPYAPYIHVVLFAGTLTLYLRLRKSR